jgi:hypothetical protein
VACEIAVSPALDFDDPGAKVSELTCGKRNGHRLLDGEHDDAIE